MVFRGSTLIMIFIIFMKEACIFMRLKKSITVGLVIMLILALSGTICLASEGGAGEKIRIMCYGDSNTWGFTQRPNVKRYPSDVRWTGVLQNNLGNDYQIIEEGLSSRTAGIDDYKNGLNEYIQYDMNFNGRPTLLPLLKSHIPLDVVVIMLGTNDFKVKFRQTPEMVAESMDKLVKLVTNSVDPEQEWYGYSVPKVLIVAPTPLNATKESFAANNGPSHELAKLYEKVAQANGVDFFDAGKVVPVPGMKDGIHLTANQHKILGDALTQKIRSMLNE